jgi:demethylmenaquinone methyltransferase/2-methoxy-6-polyprenyl-1,4-benzoquinol methylase
MTFDATDDVLQQQMQYYRARAGEYDEWFLRNGRYDRGAELNTRWFEEVQQVVRALNAFRPAGDVLELACGTGLWTVRLAEVATHVTAVDASPEVLALNQDRVKSPRITYVQADLFGWNPPAHAFDVVFFSFWLSHVPPDRFDSFWQKVRRALRPGGRFFFIDSQREPTSTAVDHHLPESAATTLRRRLNDGREFEIVKVFYDADTLRARLQELGWRSEVHTTPTYFLYGLGELA